MSIQQEERWDDPKSEESQICINLLQAMELEDNDSERDPKEEDLLLRDEAPRRMVLCPCQGQRAELAIRCTSC